MADLETLNIKLAVRDQQMQQALDRSTKAINKFSGTANRNLNRVARTYNNVGKSARVNTHSIQNASYQLQDIFVQLSMGTPITRTLSQQLPQLLGGFGALGGVLGVGIGALGLFAPALLDSSDAAKETEDSIKALSESIQNLKQAESNFSNSSDILKKYKGMSDMARELLAIQKRVAAFNAQTAFDGALRSLAGSADLGGVFGLDPDEIRNSKQAIDNLTESLRILNTTGSQRGDAGMAGAIAEIERLQDAQDVLKDVVSSFPDLVQMLGITEDAAAEVAAGFAEAFQADGPRAQAEAMLDLVNLIRDASNNLEDTTEEGRELHDKLVLAVQAAFEFASVDLSSDVTTAANEAGRLADELFRAAQVRIQDKGMVYSGRGGDPSKVGNDDYTNQLDYKPVDEVINDLKRKSSTGRKGSKGGGKSSTKRDVLQDLIREVALNEELLGVSDERAQVMRRLGQDAEKYSQAEIDGVVQRIAAYESEKAALEAIQEQQQSIADTIEDSMTDAFVSIVDGTKSASEAFKDMARAIIAQLLRVLVVQQLVGSFDSSTGTGSGIVGAIMGGLKGKASGGAVMAGSPYMVGEHGREPFIPSQNGRILSVAQSKAAMAGGAGQSINQTINVSTGVAQTVRTEMRTMMPQIIQAAKAAVSDEARRNPGFRSTL